MGIKTIVVLGDIHAGHRLGLTPPKYQWPGFALAELMERFWDWFVLSLPENPDYCFVMGDTVDGEGKKENTFHLTTDINEQINIAAEVIRQVNACKNIFIFGTPYHTGNLKDYEYQVADRFKTEETPDISEKQKVSVDGVCFDLCHKVGKTNTPVGGDIMLKKAAIWSALEDVLTENPERADYIIRAHAHEWRYTENSLSAAMICPALKIGDPNFDRYARGLDGWYDVGFLVFRIDNRKVDMEKHFFKYELPKGGYRSI
jgi:hypothetical protein